MLEHLLQIDLLHPYGRCPMLRGFSARLSDFNGEERLHTLCISQEDDAGMRQLQEKVLMPGLRFLMRYLSVIPIHSHGHMRIPGALAFDMEVCLLYSKDGVGDAFLDPAFIFLSHARYAHVFGIACSECVVCKRDEEKGHLLCHRLEDRIVCRVRAHGCFPPFFALRQQDAGTIA